MLPTTTCDLSSTPATGIDRLLPAGACCLAATARRVDYQADDCGLRAPCLAALPQQHKTRPVDAGTCHTGRAQGSSLLDQFGAAQGSHTLDHTYMDAKCWQQVGGGGGGGGVSPPPPALLTSLACLPPSHAPLDDLPCLEPAALSPAAAAAAVCVTKSIRYLQDYHVPPGTPAQHPSLNNTPTLASAVIGFAGTASSHKHHRCSNRTKSLHCRTLPMTTRLTEASMLPPSPLVARRITPARSAAHALPSCCSSTAGASCSADLQPAMRAVSSAWVPFSATRGDHRNDCSVTWGGGGEGRRADRHTGRQAGTITRLWNN